MAGSKSKAPVGGDPDLRDLRRTAGLSQQRLAELAGCSLAAIALYEGGYRAEHSTVLPRILHVLNDQRPAVQPGAGEDSAVGVGRPRGS